MTAAAHLMTATGGGGGGSGGVPSCPVLPPSTCIARSRRWGRWRPSSSPPCPPSSPARQQRRHRPPLSSSSPGCGSFAAMAVVVPTPRAGGVAFCATTHRRRSDLHCLLRAVGGRRHPPTAVAPSFRYGDLMDVVCKRRAGSGSTPAPKRQHLSSERSGPGAWRMRRLLFSGRRPVLDGV